MAARLPVVGVVLVGGLMLTGCAGEGNASAPTPSVSSEVDKGSVFSSDDVAFLTVMVPRLQQGLEVASIAAVQSDNPEVRGVAERMIETQEPVLELFEEWLVEAKEQGVKPTDLNAGTSLNTFGESAGVAEGLNEGEYVQGLFTGEQLDVFKGLSGRDFNAMFLKYALSHEEFIIATTYLTAASANNDLRVASEDIVAVESGELQIVDGLYAAYM